MDAYEEGREAARKMVRASEGPYGYRACMEAGRTFSMEVLEEWMRGWSEQLEAMNLTPGFRRKKPRQRIIRP